MKTHYTFMDIIARNIYPSAPFDFHFKHFILSIKPNEIFQIILFTLRITDLFFTPISHRHYPYYSHPIRFFLIRFSSQIPNFHRPRVVRGQLPPPSLTTSTSFARGRTRCPFLFGEHLPRPRFGNRAFVLEHNPVQS